MDKKTFKEMALQGWHYVSAYFLHYLFPVIKEAFIKTKNYFIETLWDTVKDELTSQVKGTILFIEQFITTPTYQEKEKAVIDTLFKNVSLPLALKPFRPLLKKILREKLQKLVSKHLKKLDAKL